MAPTLREFLNSTRELNLSTGDVTVVDASNPVQWGRVGASIATGIVLSVVIGVASIWTSIVNAVTGALRGVSEFVSDPTAGLGRGGTVTATTPGSGGLVEVTIGQVTVGVTDAFEGTLAFASEFGLFALPVAILIVLAAVYVVSVGGQTAFDILTGGDG